MAAQSPVIDALPGEEILEGQVFASIPLDNYVSDPDHGDELLEWSYSSTSELSISINDRVATIAPPDENWNGSGIVTFIVTDPDANTDSEDATFTVAPVNDAPVVAGIPDQSVDEGIPLDPVTLRNYVTDIDNTPEELTWSVSGEDNLSVTLNGEDIATITPDAGWTGTENLTFTATDPQSLSGSDIAGYTIKDINADPTDIDLSPASVNENALSGTEVGTLTTTDPDAGDTFTYTLVSGTGDTDNSSFGISGNKLVTAAVFDFETKSSYSVRVRSTDASSAFYEEAFTITINNVNEAPVVADIPDQTFAEGSSFTTISLDNYVTDPDHTDAQITWSYSGNTQLSVSIDASHVATMTAPSVEWFGSETVTFTATDPGSLSDSDPATFTLTSVNDLPVVTDIPGQTINEGASFTSINLDDYVSDVDNPDNQITWTASGNTQLTVSINASRVATITAPHVNWFGAETITFTATDPLSGADSDDALFTVTSINDAPVVSDIPDQTIGEGDSFSTIGLDNYVTDVDHADNQITWTATGNTQLTVSISAGRVATITTPSADWSGAETITFTARDPASASASDPATFTVTGANDPPVATNVLISPADPRIGIINTGSFTFTDPDGDLPGTHLYKWYRATNLSGSDAVAITGATAITYRPVKADGARYICFEVTPVDQYGMQGLPVKSTFKYINNSPVATNVQINAPGTQPGQTISAVFTYSDTEGNLQDSPNNIYRWYRSTVSNPTAASPGTLIGSASTYQLRSQDANAYIWFRVNPAAQAGSTPGDSVWSNVLGPIGTFGANITGSGSFCPGATMPISLSISGGVAPYTAVLTRSGSTSNKDTTISSIAASPRTINVKIPGTYVLKSLVDNGGDVADVTGSSSVILQIFPKVTAVLTGSAEVCNDGVSTASLQLNFSAGTAPWTFVVTRLRANGTLISDTTFTNVTTDPVTFPGRVISTYNPTLYRIKSLSDLNGCAGDTAGSGTARISYRASPTAVISGIDSICPDETANLQIVLTGTGPWSITYLRNGANPTIVSNITTNNYTLQVTQTGTYTLSRVQDALCTGRVSGSGIVRSHSYPTAIISGSATICEHLSTNLSVALTGAAPWKFSYRRNSETPVEVPNVLSSPRTISVNKAGTYILTEVYDKNCKGTVSGSAVITVTPAPDVELSGLAAAYNKQSPDWIPMTGTPAGGTFSGPGVIPYNSLWYFVPSLPPVGTHNIVYSYRASPSSCYGYDTAVVRVLEASAVIEFENHRTKYCRNDASFMVTGVNLANVIGTFTISGGIGLTDHHNNTATINPALLTAGEYTITYTYFDGTSLYVTSKFDVGLPPVADFRWETECYQAGKAIQMINTSTSSFGNLTDTSYYWKIYTPTGFVPFETKDISYTFPQAGNQFIELQIRNTYGCAATVVRKFSLRPTYVLKNQEKLEDFAENPLEWQRDSAKTSPTNSWHFGNPTKGFTGDHCWYTLTPVSGTAPMEQSWVTSPCYDFTDTQRPMLKISIWRLFNLDRDGATIQYSADSSKTWNVLGEIGDGLNWFNDYQIDGKPGDQRLGWSNFNGLGNDTEWKEARHSLDILKNKKTVQFRIAYGSDGTARNNNGIAFDNFWIGERNRTALLEHFTNSSDEDCDSVDAVLNDLANSNEMSIIDLQYHTSFPGSDPFNQHNPSVPGARVFYYGLSDVPFTVLNGGSKSAHRFDHKVVPLTGNTVMIESLRDSKFGITLNSKVSGNVLNVDAQVYALQDIPATPLTVHIAVIEKVITGVTGSNGETTFENVVKTMLPDAAGTTIYQAWNKDEPRYIDEYWELQHVYDTNQLRVVAFIQDESTNEVYQVALDTIGVFTALDDYQHGNGTEKSFLLYPNPAESMTFVEFEQETTEDITFELYSSQGGLVLVKQIPSGTLKTEIPVENYPDGLYILRMVSRDQLIGIGKLTITR